MIRLIFLFQSDSPGDRAESQVLTRTFVRSSGEEDRQRREERREGDPARVDRPYGTSAEQKRDGRTSQRGNEISER